MLVLDNEDAIESGPDYYVAARTSCTFPDGDKTLQKKVVGNYKNGNQEWRFNAEQDLETYSTSPSPYRGRTVQRWENGKLTFDEKWYTTESVGIDVGLKPSEVYVAFNNENGTQEDGNAGAPNGGELFFIVNNDGNLELVAQMTTKLSRSDKLSHQA